VKNLDGHFKQSLFMFETFSEILRFTQSDNR